MKTAILILATLATTCALLGPRGYKTRDWQIITALLLGAGAGAIVLWNLLNMTLK